MNIFWFFSLLASILLVESSPQSKNKKILPDFKTSPEVTCGTHYLTENSQVVFKSHSQGKKYRPNQNCEWIFQSSYPMEVDCTIKKIQKKRGCTKDYLYLSNPSVANGKRYCPKKRKTIKFSSGLVNTHEQRDATDALNEVVAIFVSDATKNYKGFTCTVSTVNHFENNNCACGQANGARIVNGENAANHEFPWIVGFVLSPDASDSIQCGGSLLNEWFALSAAHCIKPYVDNINYPIWVVAGEHYFNPPGDIHRQLREVPSELDHRLVHPNYNVANDNYDASVVKVATPFILNQFVHPICMPEVNSQFVGDIGIAAGWGQTSEVGGHPDVLQKVELDVFADSVCVTQYEAHYIEENMLCAGIVGGGKDACTGDSGGPLVVANSGQYVQAGIISFGYGCASPDFYGVYSEVAAEGILEFMETSTNNTLRYRNRCV